MAKNNVVVGAAADFLTDPHPSLANGISTAGFSSYGPTDDGGLGVDLIANGVSLRSSNFASDTAYSTASGTSMSSPNAAGTAALILEHWRNENGGTTPDSATQKGLLMHTATDASAFGLGPDYATGYGLINAAEAVGHITESLAVPLSGRERHAWEDTLVDGETLTFDFFATGGDFKASLSWLDPAATTSSGLDDRSSRLVNDLDVWVTDSLGNTFWTWVLDPENPANAAARDGHNRVDNFTQVYIDALVTNAELTLHVNHNGSLTGGSQDFSLFVSGGTLLPEILEGDLNGDMLLTLADVQLFIDAWQMNTDGGDLDLDGDTDRDDWFLMHQAFGGVDLSAVLAGGVVPEPSSLGLLAVAMAWAGRHRRSRRPRHTRHRP